MRLFRTLLIILVAGVLLVPSAAGPSAVAGPPGSGNSASHAVATQFKRLAPGAGGSSVGVLVPMDAVPEPGGWVALLSAVLAMVSIARRRSDLDSD